MGAKIAIHLVKHTGRFYREGTFSRYDVLSNMF
jgi:hypothetical protein